MTDQTRIALVSDEPLLMDALEEPLAQHGFRIVGAAKSADEALGLLDRKTADVVVLDLQMTETESIACLARIRANHPKTVVIVLSEPDRMEEIRQALSKGAAACVLKTASPSDFVTAVRQSLHQSVFFSGEPEDDAGNPVLGSLTLRELEVLQLVAEGHTNAEVARRLWVTEQTVKFHLSNIYRELGVSNRTQASRYAQLHGIIPPTSYTGKARRRLAG